MPASKNHTNQSNQEVTMPNGEVHPVRVRYSNRAKRIGLKIDTTDQIAELILPLGFDVARGMKFAQKNAHWIAKNLSALPKPKIFDKGEVVPFRGQMLALVHRPDRRDIAIDQRDGEVGRLNVGGPALGFQQRVLRFLKMRARNELTAKTTEISQQMAVKPKIIRLKDTKSRWGSCSSAGALNYSWRLIFTPPEILNYVVVHECAHLIEMNHSAAFWAIVERHDPNWRTHRQWLRTHGASLHAYG